MRVDCIQDMSTGAVHMPASAKAELWKNTLSN